MHKQQSIWLQPANLTTNSQPSTDHPQRSINAQSSSGRENAAKNYISLIPLSLVTELVEVGRGAGGEASIPLSAEEACPILSSGGLGVKMFSGSDTTQNSGLKQLKPATSLLTRKTCKLQTVNCLLLLLLLLFPVPYVSAQTSLIWSTYLGGSAHDYGRAITKDTAGNIYIAGITNSTTAIATTGSFQSVYAGGATSAGDAFLSKFSPSGTLLWSTYFGGATNEQGLCLTADVSGNIYLGGYTNSTAGIATSGCFQPSLGGNNDAFLAKFNSAGSRLWATYYGGSGNDQANALTTDNAGNIYLAGTTRSTAGISTTGAHQAAIATTTADDAFLVKFDSVGNRLWATYYGGNGNDVFYDLDCDAYGNIYAAGWVTTNSTANIATSNAFQTAYGGGTFDGMIVKFNGSGQRVWGTYFGGSLVDQVQQIVVDDTAGIYISGVTTSTSAIASATAHQSVFGGGQTDGFLARFDTSGQRIWSTYYGGSGLDQGDALVADHLGNIYLCGVTASTSGIATPGVIKDTLDLRDVYIAKFNTSGTRLWGTYIGGDNIDAPYAALWHSGKLYITGQTLSISNLATPASHQATFGGGSFYDAFLMKLDDCPAPIPADSIIGPSLICAGALYVYQVQPKPNALSYIWSLPSAWSGSSNTDNIFVTANGTKGAMDTIAVTINYLCGSSPVVTLPVLFNPDATLTPAAPQSFCFGDSVILLANTGLVTSWQWLNNGQWITGTDSTLTVTQSGAYRVITTNPSCSDTSAPVIITVNPLPVPVITRIGNDLTTGTYTTYQWSHNSNQIAGATNQVYTMLSTSGIYTVEVTDTNGCTGIAAPFDPTSIVPLNEYEDISVYPNPVKDILTIEPKHPLNTTLSTIDGRIIQKNTNTKTLDLTTLPSGIYFLRLHTSENIPIKTIKILKQ